jgi:hypothetical protein
MEERENEEGGWKGEGELIGSSLTHGRYNSRVKHAHYRVFGVDGRNF